jgi:4-hydroxy-2-oxoheptanedioate aldolase
MDIPRNTFKHTLMAGRRQLGFWSIICSPVATELLSGSGFDWILIDAEHAPNTLTTVVDQLRAMHGGHASPVVRPPANDAVHMKLLLDAGVQTFLVPFVSSVEEAARAVAATRYPPEGIRGVALTHRASGYGRVKDYFHRAQEELCVIVQLETGAAMDRLEDIAQVKGVDALFIGPADLSASLGHLGNPGHPEVEAVLADACTRARHLGKPIGTIAGSETDVPRLFEMGFNFVAAGADLTVLRRTVDDIVHKLKNVCGDSPERGGETGTGTQRRGRDRQNPDL